MPDIIPTPGVGNFAIKKVQEGQKNQAEVTKSKKWKSQNII